MRASLKMGGRSHFYAARVAIASVIGTSIEWYDFFIFGLSAALVFPTLFFPKADPLAGLLASYAIFWVGFLGRPIGGVIFGHFGDRLGRKTMLVITLTAMGAATCAIGLLPTQAQIGNWAPVLLLLLRLLQGAAVGGEWGGAVLMATEHAPDRTRGFFGSLPQVGVPIGLILSNVAYRAVAGQGEAALLNFGWRLPFLFSAVLVIVGLLVRLTVDETPAFEDIRNRSNVLKAPLLTVLARDWKAVVVGSAIFLVVNGGFYLRVTQMFSYAAGPHSILKMDPTIILNALIVGGCFALVALPASGYLSDRFGRRPVSLAGAVLSVALAFPTYSLIDTRNPILIATALGLWECVSALIAGPLPALLCELFPSNVRYTGASLSYQLVSIVGGGLAPFIATALLALSGGSSWVLALYLMLMAAISTVGVLLLPETREVVLVPA